MIHIPLTKIGFFNPGRLSDEEIEQFFITRIPFFEYLFEKIASERPKSIPQHYLVIGQRGMGKTSLLMRIAAELRKAPHDKKFIALSFPEEQYNVDRLSKFWLNCIDALADALDKENNKTELELLDAEIATITKQNDVEAKTIYELFCKWTTKIKRRPVLLVDNLNLIFAKITTEEQHQLRGTLISNDAPILVGASASTIEETINYGAPFYDAFQISYLKKLSFEESLEVLLNLAKITGNENFGNNVYKKRGRLEALYQLTGGTPRTLSILFPLIQDGFSENIQTDLDALLDVITPLYKARFEELAPQLQIVMDAVALHWDPINLNQLRTATRLPNSILSPQLKRLTEIGWLQKLDAYKAKGGAYELSERFFNIWYLMRRSSRRQKRELYCLTKFLESFYGKDLHDIAKNRITCKSESINHITIDLALADAVKDKLVSEQLKRKGYNALFLLSENDNNILKDFTIPKEIVTKRILQLSISSDELYKNKEYEEAEIVLNNIISMDNQNEKAWLNLGHLYQFEIVDFKKAEFAILKVIEINSKNASPWSRLGYLYMEDLKDLIQSEIAFKKALEIDSEFMPAMCGLGELYKDFEKDFEKAELQYLDAVRIEKNNENLWNTLGDLYREDLNKWKEAEEAYKTAISYNEKNSDSWHGLGMLYFENTKDFLKAEVSLKTANEINPTDIFTLFALGKLYQFHLNKYLDAEAVLNKAINIDDTHSFPWLCLGDLYENQFQDFNKAELAYKNAIKVDEKSSHFAWLRLGDLYKNNFKNYVKAENAYINALNLDITNVEVLNSLGNLYQDNFKKYLDAEVAYKKAIRIESNENCAKYNLTFLLRDKLNKLEEAKELFSSINITKELNDSHCLNEALFALHEKNIGLAESFLQKAFIEIGDKLPTNTEDDWYRASATFIKMGYGSNLLQVLSQNDYDTILRPFYVAIQFLTNKEQPLFFNSIAAEVREPAKKIVEILKNLIE